MLPPPIAPDPAAHWPDARRSFVFVRRLCALYGLAALALMAAVVAASAVAHPPPALARFARGGAAGAALGSIGVALAGLLGTLAVAWARAHVTEPYAGRRAPAAPGWRAVTHPWRLIRPPAPAPALVGAMARRPQGTIVPLTCLAAGIAAWMLRGHGLPPAMATDAFTAGGAAFAIAFPLLIGERMVAALPAARLPEAAALRALLFVPVLACAVAGAAECAAGAGLPGAGIAMTVVAWFVVAVAAELGVRALGQWFLPPPEPQAARAAIQSAVASIARAPALGPGGAAGVIRAQFGIDFSRSWALAYMRAAFAPVLLLMLAVCWGLSGVALIGLDQRGIYERFGAPVAVLRPGLHVVLPWPLGRVRRAELGVVHSVPLGTGLPAAREDRAGAEDPAPPAADRLWDQSHASEVSYVIASETAGAGAGGPARQSFQVVSADMRVLFREGLSDENALRVAYRTEDPELLVRSEAGRLVSRFFAERTLATVLGAEREAVANGLRAALQAQLDRLGSGLEVLAVVVEAIHPPLGAADAYHNVQAAEIQAHTMVAVETGKSVAAGNMARQEAEQTVDQARGAAAETVADAAVATRQFTADQAAAATGGEAFLLERYLGNLAAALPKSRLVIVDHRVGKPDAPVIDLRPFGAPTPTNPDED
jgi:regulator of protease activity HflC (stomatin/prohibitin superfamily)